MVKMRLSLALALLPGLAAAAILPNAIGPYQRHDAAAPPALSGSADIWKEFGLKDTDSVSYARPGMPVFSAVAYHLADSTAAMAAFYWQRPASSKPSKAAPLAAETPDGLLVAHGDYLLVFDGYKPSKSELQAVLASLPRADRTALPVTYLPEKGLVPNSERYVTGPAGLQAFLPGIPLSAAGFDLGAEVQSAVFHSPKGDVTLAVFNYPTPQIAMLEVPKFEKSGLATRRSLSLVAVTLPVGADADFSRMLLDQIRYQAKVTIPEHIPTLRDNPGLLVLNIFILIGIVLAITLVGGLGAGVVRAFQRRGGRDPDANTVITLHLK